MPNVFTESEADTTVDVSQVTIDVLVGEGQKYKTPDDLAKAYINADSYIEAAKAKQAELEAELKVLRDLREAQAQNPSAEQNVNSQPRQIDPPVVVDREKNESKDLQTLVREELENADKQRRAADNVNKASSYLAEHFGSGIKANQFIQQKAKELDVSVDWLMDVAAKSPSALYRTLGVEGTPSVSTPNASMADRTNTAAFNRDKTGRGFKYYEEIRKSDPKAYYSTTLQQQMFNDRRTQGDSFFNS